MTKHNQKLILILAVITTSLVLLIIHRSNSASSVYVSFLRSQNVVVKTNSKFDRATKDTSTAYNGDSECDNDNIFVDTSGHSRKGRTQEKSKYLEHRRFCILKYCGDVCDTKKEFEDGKTCY